MKKQLVTLALILVTGFTGLFANNSDAVSANVRSAFEKEFANAKNISWKISKEFSKATFTVNDQVLFAYYSEGGQLLAVSRNLLSAQLPINLSVDLKKSYAGFWISDLFEMAANGESTYYATVENADHKYILKSSGMRGWTIFKKEKKDSEQ